MNLENHSDIRNWKKYWSGLILKKMAEMLSFCWGQIIIKFQGESIKTQRESPVELNEIH